MLQGPNEGMVCPAKSWLVVAMVVQGKLVIFDSIVLTDVTIFFQGYPSYPCDCQFL